MFRGNELERLYRDVRCGGFHPGNDAITHEMVGKSVLGILTEQPRSVTSRVEGRVVDHDRPAFVAAERAGGSEGAMRARRRRHRRARHPRAGAAS